MVNMSHGAVDHIVNVTSDADEPLDADPLLRQLREQRYGLAQKIRSVGPKCAIFNLLVVLLVFPLIVNFDLPWNWNDSSELEPKAFNAMAKKQEELGGQGGTLEAGPGCPSTCGSFVACALNVSSENNLLPLQLFTFFGLFPLPQGLEDLALTNRLYNKQITIFKEEYQCPDSDCWIPNAFLNDDFCDCPGSCADESNHDCDTCGGTGGGIRPGVGCPTICAGLNDINSISCLGTGTSVGTTFVCPGSNCGIDPLFVDDNRCDCPDCADETNWTCSNCSCPSICGVSLYPCDGSGVFSCPTSNPDDQVCNLPGSLQQNLACDCPGTCADELGNPDPFIGTFPFDCTTCRCPLSCGQDIFQGLADCINEFFFFLFPPFQCSDGCEIPFFFQDDGTCHCSDCADESQWDCTTCACPEFCNQNLNRCEEIYFQCPESACAIGIFEFNNNRCDCPGTCADEENWTCESCETFGYGCPANTSCGVANDCDRRILTCQQVPGEPTCEYVGYQFNDDRCDCPLCDDEPFWDCSSCFFGCPAGACVEFGNPCLPERTYPGFEVQCPGGVGCSIDSSRTDDGQCDCPGTCADETQAGWFCPLDCMGFNCPPDCAAIQCPTRRLSELELNKTVHRVSSSASPHASVKAPADSPQSSANTVSPNHLTTGSQGIVDSIVDCLGVIQEAVKAVHMQRQERDAMDGTDATEPTDAMGDQRVRRQALEKFFGRKVNPALVAMHAALEAAFEQHGAKEAMEAMKVPLQQSDGTKPSKMPALAFSEPLSRVVLREAVEIFFDPKHAEPKHWEKLKEGLTKKFTAPGFEAAERRAAQERRLQDIAATTKPTQSKQEAFKDVKEKLRQSEKFDPLLFLLQEMARVHYAKMGPKMQQSMKSEPGESPEAQPRLLQVLHGLQKTSTSPPGRRTQADLISLLAPADAFRCPNDAGCVLPRAYVNDRKCDCPGDCADEDSFTCDTCVPDEPFSSRASVNDQTALGASLGVSLGAAIGIGLGVGLGISAGLGAYIAAGFVQLSVINAEEFISSPQVQSGMKQAFLRLAGLKVAETVVELNWACASDALSKITARLLQQSVNLCFEITIDGQKESADVCQVLSSTSLQGAQSVIKEELTKAGADDSIEIVQWTPEENPLSKNPNLDKKSTQSTRAFLPGNKIDGFDLG